MRRMFRAEIPVDDLTHTFAISGPILHIAAREESVVEFWHLDDTDKPPTTRAFRIVGTGQPIHPSLTAYIGSAITPSGQLVWHVFEHEQVDRD